MSYKVNSQQIQWLMRVGAGCAMEPALAPLNCRVIQSTSDEAPGLLAYVEHYLEAHHSPDLFHVQHELGKAVSWTCSHDTGHIWEEILPHPSESRSLILKALERQ